MKHYKQKYHFARISIIDAIDDNKSTFYLNAFSAPVHIEHYKFRYMIANEKIIDYEGNQFIYGELVKYKRVLETDVMNEDKKIVVEGKLPYGVVAQSKFFIHLDTQVVAYHPIANRISNNQFLSYLTELIEVGYDEFFVQAKISLIDEEVKISEAIKILGVIKEISIDVHPTNPSNWEVYRDLDERFKRLKVAREILSIYAEEGGFNIEELMKDDIYKGIMLAVDGYGKASLTGEKEDGSYTKISTGDSPITKEVSDSDDPKAVLVQLFNAFSKIWRRKNRDN